MKTAYMKSLLLLIVTACISIASNAVELLDGYIVKTSKDTVKCKIKQTHSMDFHKSVSILTEQGERLVYHAKDKKIVAFGFTLKGVDYVYLYIEVKPNPMSGFYQAVVIGPKYTLYGHILVTAYTSFPYYVLYNSAGKLLNFSTCTLCPWKQRLRQALKDDTASLHLLDDVRRVSDIPNFVLTINEQ
jgi:hypothetical protein